MSDWITEYAEKEWQTAAFTNAKDLEACLRWFHSRAKVVESEATEIYGIEADVWSTMGWEARFRCADETCGELLEKIEELRKERDHLCHCMAKVMGHTAYLPGASRELLAGLLDSIQRIATEAKRAKT